MATLDRTVKVQLRNASVRVSPAVSARGLWQVTNVIKVLINPNTILLIWILYNSKSWMPKYFWFELLFVVIYCQNGNEDDVYVCIICIHNVLLQEKCYLIHMLMAYLNSIFYVLSFFFTQIFKRFIIWNGRKKQKCLHWRHYHFGKYKPQYDTK